MCYYEKGIENISDPEIEELKKIKEELLTEVQELSSKLYNNSYNANATQNTSEDDDIIDGNFKEI